MTVTVAVTVTVAAIAAIAAIIAIAILTVHSVIAIIIIVVAVATVAAPRCWVMHRYSVSGGSVLLPVGRSSGGPRTMLIQQLVDGDDTRCSIDTTTDTTGRDR